MKRFLFSIALLFTALAGCSNHEGESAAPKSELNVMSYNIRYANASDKGDAAWDARKEASVTMIRDVKPDVIGMQEPRFSQAQYLIGELTEYEHYYLAPDDKDSQHRNAVWWRKDRFEMLAQGYFFLNEKDITQPIKGWGTTSSARHCGSNCASAAPARSFSSSTPTSRTARRPSRAATSIRWRAPSR